MLWTDARADDFRRPAAAKSLRGRGRGRGARAARERSSSRVPSSMTGSSDLCAVDGQDDEVALDAFARGQHALARHQAGDDYLRAEVLVLDGDDLQPRPRQLVQTADQLFEHGREERPRQDGAVQARGVARRPSSRRGAAAARTPRGTSAPCRRRPRSAGSRRSARRAGHVQTGAQVNLVAEEGEVRPQTRAATLSAARRPRG